MSRRVRVVALCGLIAGSAYAGPPPPGLSEAILNGHSNIAGKFCAVGESLNIHIECTHEDLAHGSSCTFGSVLLTGPETYRFDQGSHDIKPGCYTQKLADSHVSGHAVLSSKIYYTRLPPPLPAVCAKDPHSCHL